MPVGRVAELVGITLLATAVTLAIAAPLLVAPTTRVFGMEIVGRHHDPFTVMAQIAQPLQSGLYSQPVTDLAGHALARFFGAVAGYNVLVLLSFPLSAMAAYLVARHLALSSMASAMAAMAFAFSPFHLAHAAYHPQIAQTQWIPLYLLALWRCLDLASPAAVALLVASAIAVTLSNFYGGLIAAVITPVALAGYWLTTRQARPNAARRLVVTLSSLALVAAAGLVYVRLVAPGVMSAPASLAFPRADLFRYSATSWSYLVPPVEHPLLGAMASRLWAREGVGIGLLEQQVYLGWSLIALSLVAVAFWLFSARGGRAVGARAFVPLLAGVAAIALVCSLSPEQRIGPVRFVRPSAFFYEVAPMFRSYARFGVVVQLMTALLAGIGLDALRRSGARAATAVTIALVAVFVAEYSVSPSAMSRDVLPTTTHRWVADQPGPLHVLDCAPLSPESESIRWLSNGRISPADASDDCLEPEFPGKLAAGRYTHLIVRRQSDAGRRFATFALPGGLGLARHFPAADVYTVTASPPAIYTAGVQGFSPRESDAAWSWRWMGTDASWTIVNTTDVALAATTALELSAFHHTRRLEIRIDGRLALALDIGTERRVYTLGPFRLSPGAHLLVFHPVEPPNTAGTLIGNGDTRALSFAIGTWRWTSEGLQP